MRRRDISKVLMGSAAGSLLLTSASQAQSSCTAPCYALAAGELAAEIVNYEFLPLDVRRYGAILDGITDDTQALSRAIGVATRNGGGEIVIPPGTLRLTAPLSLSLRVSLRGFGREISLIKIDGAFVGLSLAAAMHNETLSQAHTRIERIGFRGTASTRGALRFSLVDWILIRDCSFRNLEGTNAFGVELVQCYRWTIEHSYFENITLVGLNLVAVNDIGCNHGVFGPNNEVIGNNKPAFIGVNVSRSQNVTLLSNDFEGSGNGNKAIDLDGVEGVWISGNYIEQWTQAAIAANSGMRNQRVYVMENVINASSAQICNFNNVAAPNDNVVFALNRFPDIASTQVCVFAGNTTRFVEFNNDPDAGKITELQQPSAIAARQLQNSAAWNPGAIASNGVGTLSLTIPGAVVGDVCVASFDQLGSFNFLISAHVTAGNTVKVILANKEVGAIDLPAGTVRVRVLK